MQLRYLVLGVLIASQPIGAWADAISAEEFGARRAAVARAVGADAMVLLLAPQAQRRNGDVDWPYRQEDNLYWLTGVDQPESALAMIPGEGRTILFARDRDPRTELWNGKIPDHAELARDSGIAEVVSSTRLDAFVSAALEGRWFTPTDDYRYYRAPELPQFSKAVEEGQATVWLLLEQRPAAREPLPPALALAADLKARFPEVQIRDLTPIVEGLREIKSEAELALLQRAVDITGEGIAAAMRRVATATHEHQLEAAIELTFRDRGACCAGYPSIVAAGSNATILHYARGEDPIDRAGLVLLDVGAEVERYTADISRTFPANGRFSDVQREVYEVVLAAWHEGLEELRVGSSLAAMHRRVERAVAAGLLPLGLVTEASVEQARLYLPHGTGHPIGLFVHDSFDRVRSFEPGMVVTLEPGVYVRPDDVRASETYRSFTEKQRAMVDRALSRYAGIGVRIEDDIAITTEGPRVLSEAIPRTVEAIEAALAGAAITSE